MLNPAQGAVRALLQLIATMCGSPLTCKMGGTSVLSALNEKSLGFLLDPQDISQELLNPTLFARDIA